MAEQLSLFGDGGSVDAGEAHVKIFPSFKGFRTALESGLNKSFKSKIASAERFGKSMTRAVTLPLLGAAAAGVKMALNVEKGLRSVNSLFGLTGAAGRKNFEEIAKGVRKLSDDMGIAQETLADGLYQAISAGVPKKNAFTFMRTAAKAAIAGATDTNTAVEGLTKTMNAFGIGFEDAERVADSMFTTVNKGIVTFEEMSSFMFQVAPAASAAGLSLEETNAALTALTLQGIPMAVAATRVQAGLSAIARNAKDLDPIFKKLGFESAEVAVKQKGLKFALDAVKEASGGTQKGLFDLLGRVEAVQLVNVLAGKGADEFTDALKDQANAAGASGKAFNELEKSGARKLERAFVAMKNALIDVGNILIPIITNIANKIAEWARAFSGLDDGTKRMILTIVGIVAVLGPLLSIIGNIIAAVRLLAIAITFLVTHPGVALVALLVALAIAFNTGSSAARNYASAIDAISAANDRLKQSQDALKSAEDQLPQAKLDQRQSKLSLQSARQQLREGRERGASGNELKQLVHNVAQAEQTRAASVQRVSDLEKTIRQEKRRQTAIGHTIARNEEARKKAAQAVTDEIVKQGSGGSATAAQQAAQTLADKYKNGEISAENIRAAIDRIPNAKNVRVYLETEFGGLPQDVPQVYAPGYDPNAVPGPVKPSKKPHTGGVVPGPFSHEQWILARGQERVLTPAQAKGEGGHGPMRGKLTLVNGEAYVEMIADNVLSDDARFRELQEGMRR